MRELNSREKNLGVLVALICLPFLATTVTKKLNHQALVAADRLAGAQRQVEEAQAQLTRATERDRAPAAQTTPTVEGRHSMTLLNDLTLPPETKSIRVMRVERTGETTFRMELNGEFSEMMRFLSYLERGDSRFSVATAEIHRTQEGPRAPAGGGDVAEATEPVESARLIRGIFNLVSKG